MDFFFVPIAVAAAVSGAGLGFVGVALTGLRAPLLSAVISHAALAGAVWAMAAGFDQQIGAMAAAALSAGALALLDPDKPAADTQTLMAVILSAMLGLAFLGLGLVDAPSSQTLSLLWGSLLFITPAQTAHLAFWTGILAVFLVVFSKEMQAILFSRSMAAASGIHQRLIFGGFLTLAGVVMAVNLRLIGGLMLFSLTVNPAAAAWMVGRGWRQVCWLATGFGAAAALGGFAASYWLDLPVGACIVLASGALVAVAAVIKAKWKRQ